jgi:hypothetical protein
VDHQWKERRDGEIRVTQRRKRGKRGRGGREREREKRDVSDLMGIKWERKLTARNSLWQRTVAIGVAIWFKFRKFEYFVIVNHLFLCYIKIG